MAKAKAKAKDKNVGKTFFIPANALQCDSVHDDQKSASDEIAYDLYDDEVGVLYEVTVVRRFNVQKKLTVIEA